MVRELNIKIYLTHEDDLVSIKHKLDNIYDCISKGIFTSKVSKSTEGEVING